MKITLAQHILRFLRCDVRWQITLFLIASYAGNTSANQCFDDGNLEKLLIRSPQRAALVYVWSPRMVYSVHNMTTAARAASDAGLDFVVLHDRRVPELELQHLRISSLALCSVQLMERDALRHFPTAFVISAGRIHQHPIVGAMPSQAWDSSLMQRLNQPVQQP